MHESALEEEDVHRTCLDMMFQNSVAAQFRLLMPFWQTDHSRESFPKSKRFIPLSLKEDYGRSKY
jgi:hypothetical protein